MRAVTAGRGSGWVYVLALLGIMTGLHTTSAGNIDPTNGLAWAENIGWVKYVPDVTVHFNGTNGYLTGYAWAENIGWIKLGAAISGPYHNNSAVDWGVNLAASGTLSGYAWSESVGWISFSSIGSQMAIDLASGCFEGYAWGENCGWISAAGLKVNFIPVVITDNPQSQAVNLWSAATFTVTAAGTPPLFYQWQKNSVNIVGASNASYTIVSVVGADAADFRCLVSNMVNTTTSAAAALTVNEQMIVPTNVTVSAGIYADKIRITWSPVRLALGYEVWRNISDIPEAALCLGKNIAVPYYDDLSAADGRTYYYWIKSKHVLGTSAFSASASGWRRSAGLTYYADADMDGDGKMDLVLYDRATGTWCVKLSASGYNLASAILGGPGYTVVPGDYDGDGKTDPAVYEEATGIWTVMLSGSGYPRISATFGGPGCMPVPGDFDADRKTDPAVYRLSDGTWGVMLSGSGYAVATAPGFGGYDYTPVQRDYDGDLKTDPALYLQAAGNWHVMLSASSYGIASALGFGGPEAAPVPGDYDGDGKTDPAVYQESTAYWYVMLSGSGYGIGRASFGGPGCTAVPGDFDGDGKTDPAVYRLSDGTWGVMLSGSGYGIASANFGGPGYDPVWLSPAEPASGLQPTTPMGNDLQ